MILNHEIYKSNETTEIRNLSDKRQKNKLI